MCVAERNPRTARAQASLRTPHSALALSSFPRFRGNAGSAFICGRILSVFLFLASVNSSFPRSPWECRSSSFQPRNAPNAPKCARTAKPKRGRPIPWARCLVSRTVLNAFLVLFPHYYLQESLLPAKISRVCPVARVGYLDLARLGCGSAARCVPCIPWLTGRSAPRRGPENPAQGNALGNVRYAPPSPCKGRTQADLAPTAPLSGRLCWIPNHEILNPLQEQRHLLLGVVLVASVCRLVPEIEPGGHALLIEL